MPQEVHEKAYNIACTGATDNTGGTGVDTYKIYAEEITGNPADPTLGDFNSATIIGELSNLPYLPCYYKFSTQPDHNQLKLRKSDGASISPGGKPAYGPDNVYPFKWRTWEHGKRYRIWILAVDQTGNMESLNASGTANSLDKALFATPVLQEDELIFNNTPTLSTSEGTSGEDDTDIDVNKAETSTSIFTFNNLTPSLGKLSKIVVYYKKSTNTTYRPFAEFEYHADLEDATGSTATYRRGITLTDKPINFDFRAVFLNPNNIPAKVSGAVLKVEDTGVTFNGVPDLSEYVEVKNLSCTNITGGESGTLPSQVAELEWTDPRSISRSSWGSPTYVDSGGGNISLTWTQAQRISAFVVYMFLSSDGQPPDNTRPGQSTGGHGTWYFMGRFEKANASIRCPQGATLAFWVGFMTDNTSATTTHTRYEF